MRRLAITLGILLAAAKLPADDRPVEFNRDVRPILADHCYQCHGPDAAQRQAELRLDQEESALAAHEGKRAIVPGKLAESELLRRITAADPGERMPPAEAPRKLTDEQIATLRRWIEQGAKWQKHWSFLPPKRPEIIAVANADHAHSPIDALILARLAAEKLTPSPPADRATLLRRVTLDLTGLPPSPEEIAAFLGDESPDAYERVVDRLLVSPRYGERMATPWLNAARYADTHGYQSDGERIMWRWRDWVIEAYNRNQPFDQFTIEQLAGDLLPSGTLDMLIATGFNRNHRGNSEGGIVPEEYAVEYVVDRVETTSTVWLGLTMGCVRCHDHKFDPFTQRDFYSLYAFFNNIPENGRALKYGNSPPTIMSPTRLQQARSDELGENSYAALVKRDKLVPQLRILQSEWERSYKPAEPIDWQPSDDLLLHFSLDSAASDQNSGRPLEIADGKCSFGKGVIGQSVEFDGHATISAGDCGDFGFYDRFSLSAWVWIPEGGGGTIVSRMSDTPEGDGWQFAIVDGKLQFNLVKRWLDDAIRVESSMPVPSGGWHHVAAVYNGSRWARGVSLHIDGDLKTPDNVLLDELYQPFAAKQPLRIGSGGGPAQRFRGKIDEVRLYNYDLVPWHIQALAARRTIPEIVARPAAERSENEREKLKAYFLDRLAPPQIRTAFREREAARRESLHYDLSLPTTMIMHELPDRKPAYVLVRGQYDRPGEEVSRDVPGELMAFPKNAPRNRLGLALWLVDPAHPLTSRVTVNRYWQMYFGVGLVKTAEDFGSQGEWPVHPELLDLLATEFIASGWDVKAMQRAIVTSGTYRQSSQLAPQMAQRDPENRLLARGPRVRLSAEMVRDQALAASGLLVEEVGGPSVRPYQPAGIWKELTGGDDYQVGQGADLYRRSLYTYWKRTIPPPALATFDAASREFCTIRETRTNTPLQALVLLNDETYVEAARLLAERVMRESREQDERLRLAFQLVLSRELRPQEQRILRSALERHLARYRAAPGDAEKVLAVGQFPRDAQIPAAELAAYAAVCGTILNLDEAVMKE